MPDHLGPYPLEGVAMKSWLLQFDKNGECTSPETRRLLLAWLGEVKPSHLVVFSHGWNNDFEDAGRLYSAFMRRVEPRLAAAGIDNIGFVGLVWPSTWWPENEGLRIAGDAGGHVSAASTGEGGALLASLSDSESRERARSLLEKPRLDDAEAAELATLAASALDGNAAREGREPASGPDSEDLVVAGVAIQHGNEEEFSDDFGGVDLGTGAGTQAPGLRAAGTHWLDPRNIVRAFTVYQMKDRAGRVGSNGVHLLLCDMLAAGPSMIHGLGHSYGCKVMLSAVCAGHSLPRPLTSLLLLQPAVSHLCFAERIPGTDLPGGYRAALSPDRVERPIRSTYSRHDLPLHEGFHLALRRKADLGERRIAAGGTSAGEPPSPYAALGGYGPRGADEKLVDPIPAEGEPYPDPAGKRIVAFDGTKQKRISGHGDVVNAIAAWALSEQILGG